MNRTRFLTAALLAAAVAIPAVPAAAGPPTCSGYAVTVQIGLGQAPTDDFDVILGTQGPDVIHAGAGNDVVCSLGGDDVVRGGPGGDDIFGGRGRDVLRGEGQSDGLYGQRGPDQLFGGVGDDLCNGGPDVDGHTACELVPVDDL